MRIALLTALHRRHALAGAMLAHCAGLRARFSARAELFLYAVLSLDDLPHMADPCRDAGVFTSVCGNNPVSAKWQHGLDFVRDRCPDADAVLILGSDDFVNDPYLDMVLRILDSGLSLGFGPDRIWWLHEESGHLGLCKGVFCGPDGHRMPLGNGRVFTRELLDRANWRLWTRPADSGLDGLSHRRLVALGYGLDIIDLDRWPGAIVVGVKGESSMHCWTEVMQGGLISIRLDPQEARARLAEWRIPQWTTS